MRKKIIIFAIILLVITILIITNLSTERDKNVDNLYQNISEIQPEEEINTEEENMTEISLYYMDSQSGVLVKTSKNVNAKDLLSNPYKFVLETLINGPEDQKLTNAISKNTKINSVELKDSILTVDLSEDFLDTSGMNAINAIVNTMTEFNEIDGVKILINGETKDGLKEVFVRNNKI